MAKRSAKIPVYTLDGEKISVFDFMEANAEELTRSEMVDILLMRVGDEIRYGGGAAPLAVLKRIR